MNGVTWVVVGGFGKRVKMAARNAIDVPPCKVCIWYIV